MRIFFRKYTALHGAVYRRPYGAVYCQKEAAEKYSFLHPDSLSFGCSYCAWSVCAFHTVNSHME